MPSTVKFVCLADSRKKSGHCIAGKIVEGRSQGKWIRPISSREESSLNDRDISYEDGEIPQVLDLISIQVKESAPSNHHRENYIIDDTFYWVKDGVLRFSQVDELCDDVQDLWLNGYHSWHGTNDKVPAAIVHEKIKNSLLLIKPKSVQYNVGQEYAKKKVRALFKFNGSNYSITVTDKIAEKYFLNKKEGTYKDKSDKLYFCVSLGQEYYGYCYKLIAGIIEK